MKKFFEEFKKFIMRGNIVDMSVGVIVGGAFTSIVNGLTNNILKPIINWFLALILGTDSLSEVFTYLKRVEVPELDANGVATGKMVVDLTQSIYIDWGAFINAIINFLIIAFVLFVIVKAINALNETSYTADVDMTMVMKNGNSSYTQEMKMLMECDPNNVYMILEVEENNVYSFAKINGQEVLVYVSVDGKEWELEETLTLEEFKNENSQIIDAEEVSNFKYEDGVYVGDVEALNSALTEYMNSTMEEIQTPGLSIDSTKVTKYNITLDKKNVSKIEIDMEMSMSGFGQTIEVTYTIVMNISKVDETQVTIPTNLNA